MFRNITLKALTHAFKGNYSQQTRSLRLYKERTLRTMYWRGRSFDRIKFPEQHRSARQEWSYRAEIFAFSRRLQENISEDTLRQIFADPTYLDKVQSDQTQASMPDLRITTNTQLVHKGQEALHQLVMPYLRYVFPQLPEDGVRCIADYLGSDTVLEDVAKWIGCKDLVLTAESPPASRTLANTVRALVAGIEADLSRDRARRFVIDMIVSYLNDKDIFDDIWTPPNPKETLNLILTNSQLPKYEPRIMFQTGVRTLEACHMVGLFVNQRLLGSSAGETLTIAEECAALDALQGLFDLKESRGPLIYGEDSEKIDYVAHEKEHNYIKTWSFKLV